MQTFKDTTGQPWEIAFTVLIRRTVRSRCGVDIATMLKQENLIQFGNEPELLIDTLWACVESQAKTRGVSFDEFFGERIDEETLDQCIELLFDEHVEYSPKKKRPHLRKLLNIYRTAGKAATTASTRTIANISDADIERYGIEIANLIHTKSTNGKMSSPGQLG